MLDLNDAYCRMSLLASYAKYTIIILDNELS